MPGMADNRPAREDASAPAPLRVLVTGGLGYAGSYISARLARAGHELSILSRGREKPDFGSPYALITANLQGCSPQSLADLLPEGLDAVVHAAGVNEDVADDYARKALLVNAFGTRTLLEALRLKSGRDGSGALPLVIYVSTVHVYGRASGAIDENSPAAPRNDYALTHYFAEEYCRMAARQCGFPAIVLRLSNGYGAPRGPASDTWRLLINDLCQSAVRRGELEPRSDPSTPRDFIWLGDLARVVQALLGRKDLAGRV
ncbi:MAG: SDR family oxidoreductase, partial [Desulfovibrio sp.]|nr:SDR family oxidoreductase [Desulfovibrio sp.]